MFLFADEVVQKAKSFPVVFGHATAARRWLYLGLSSDWSGAGRVCRKLGRFVNLTASSHFVTFPVSRDHGMENLVGSPNVEDVSWIVVLAPSPIYL